MATSKKEVAKTNDQMPTYIKQGQARGNENVTQDDLQLPRIDVLQGLSPQINKKKDEYIEGAEVGMLFNTLTGELYPDGIIITPVSFVKRFLVWVDRDKDNNGGLRGVFDDAASAEDFIQSQDDEDKLELVPTAEHLVLLENGTEVIMSMAKSKMKVSRKFNSLIRLNGGDRFSRSYRVTSVDDEGSKGEYQNLQISAEGFPSEEVYLKAERLYEAIQGGTKQAGANYSDVTDSAGGEEKEEY